jgi:type IV secretory pathway TraG/TraD family ATPase VirD4
VTFAHQAVGDLEGLGPEVKNQIQTNTNLKVFMRTNEPESAEYYSKTIGTKLTEKVTKRQTQGIFGKEVTGEGSLREAEEFIYHPNVFKRELGLGEAILILSHERGSKPIKIKFGIRENLPVQIIPEFFKKAPEPLVIDSATSKKDEILEPNVLEQAAISNKELINKINQGVPVWEN